VAGAFESAEWARSAGTVAIAVAAVAAEVAWASALVALSPQPGRQVGGTPSRIGEPHAEVAVEVHVESHPPADEERGRGAPECGVAALSAIASALASDAPEPPPSAAKVGVVAGGGGARSLKMAVLTAVEAGAAATAVVVAAAALAVEAAVEEAMVAASVAALTEALGRGWCEKEGESRVVAERERSIAGGSTSASHSFSAHQ